MAERTDRHHWAPPLHADPDHRKQSHPARHNAARRFPGTRPRLFWFGCGLLAVSGILAMFGPWLAPYDPTLPVGPPLQPPGAGHPLGTNDIGQDVLSQLIAGARTSLVVALAVAAISAALSWLVGLAAGLSRRLEAPLIGLADLLLALPSIPLYLLIVTLVGPSQTNLILTLGLLSWPAFARVVRSVVIRIRAEPYVEAARGLGGSSVHVARRHLLPATLDILPTKVILTVRFAIFAEATLAFLGLAQSGTVSWGSMLSWAFSDPLLFARPVWPWLVLPPAVAIATVILATTWVTTGLQHAPATHASGTPAETAGRHLARAAPLPAEGPQRGEPLAGRFS